MIREVSSRLFGLFSFLLAFYQLRNVYLYLTKCKTLRLRYNTILLKNLRNMPIALQIRSAGKLLALKLHMSPIVYYHIVHDTYMSCIKQVYEMIDNRIIYITNLYHYPHYRVLFDDMGLTSYDITIRSTSSDNGHESNAPWRW